MGAFPKINHRKVLGFPKGAKVLEHRNYCILMPLEFQDPNGVRKRFSYVILQVYNSVDIFRQLNFVAQGFDRNLPSKRFLNLNAIVG